MLYNVDTTGLHEMKTPDDRIQHYLKYQYDLEKIKFEGRSLVRKHD